MSDLISKDEFTAARSDCDKEIAELQSVIDSIDKQHQMIGQQQLIKEIKDAVNEIAGGVEYEDDFYKHILDKMVVMDKDNIDVYLKLLPVKWIYAVAGSKTCLQGKQVKRTVAHERDISEASVPISFKSPATSL